LCQYEGKPRSFIIEKVISLERKEGRYGRGDKILQRKKTNCLQIRKENSLEKTMCSTWVKP